MIHLESFQQFLINMKVQGQEVTPFLNQLYQNKATISFDNFFHEVGQGKRVMRRTCWKQEHSGYRKALFLHN